MLKKKHKRKQKHGINHKLVGALGHQKPRASQRPPGITWKEIQGFLKSLQPIWCQFQSCSFPHFLWWICFLGLSLDFVEDKRMPIPMIFTLPVLASGRALRATLDEGPRSRDQWIQATLLVESFKLIPRPLDEGPRPKSGRLRLNLLGTCFGGKINWFRTKKQC